jgi:acylphosphatase
VPDSEVKERRCVHYSGLVQGVGFRYTARNVAQSYQVTGYVQNLSDGRVKLIVEGTPNELDHFLAAVRAALAENIEKELTDTLIATGEFNGFDIRF